MHHELCAHQCRAARSMGGLCVLLATGPQGASTTSCEFHYIIFTNLSDAPRRLTTCGWATIQPVPCTVVEFSRSPCVRNTPRRHRGRRQFDQRRDTPERSARSQRPHSLRASWWEGQRRLVRKHIVANAVWVWRWYFSIMVGGGIKFLELCPVNISACAPPV